MSHEFGRLRRLLWVLGSLVLIACARSGPSVRTPTLSPASTEARAPAWRGLDADAFAQARRERKLLLLSVQAEFCHWCHVMNATTYRDPRVVALLRERFVTLRVDESERPDLAARYADWGWPATAILTPDAEPVVTLRGHRPAAAFRALLEQLLAQLDAGTPLVVTETKSASPLESDLAAAQQQALSQLDGLYDAAQGGWGTPQKYPFPAPVEHALLRAYVRDEPQRRAQARTTLAGHAQLLDAVAGGMFQYSLRGVWSAPHYEKLAASQAAALLTFSDGYRATGETRWLDAARGVAAYVIGTLRTPHGGFAASQNADVGELGTNTFVTGAEYYALNALQRADRVAPALNTHVYANLNGLVIQGLCAFERASGDRRALATAQAALTALSRTHARGAAFLHAADDASGRFYLSDQVEMIGALWSLADALHDASLRERAYATMDFVIAQLADSVAGGFYAHTPDPSAVGLFARIDKPASDNARFARLLLRRARFAHDDSLLALAQRTLSALSASDAIARQGRKVADLLLALEEAHGGYLMFSVVGHRDDPRTRALVDTAYRAYVPHGILRVDAPGEGLYPYPGQPAVYLCSDSACSAEVTAPDALHAAIAAFVASAREH
jgi:uncharacterized protein YyaL (SSP411 family)